MPNLIQIIKQAAIEAVEASNPTKLIYGTVVNSSPSIKINQKLTLPSDFLILTRNVMKYETVILIDGVEKEVTIDNSLQVGDKVLLIQEQGGQKYVVLDKVGG